MSASPRLPIDEHLPRIVEGIDGRGAVVLEAAPGAGKTTRVPRALLDSSSIRGQILVLEPRRIAARAAAARVASELGESVGGTVGYQVRLETRASSRTRVVFVTEGVLTRRLMGDPELRGVGAVILDELHERHLHTDVALALVTHMRRTARPDLRVLAMSATLDAEPVVRLLEAERVVCDVPAHSVAIEYAPSREPIETQVAVAVRRALREEPTGHVLVFLPGVGDIRRALERCQPIARDEGVRLFELHGSLTHAEQDAALAPSKERKVILATNVAESSLTIDGVRTVIDSGLAKVARVEPGATVATLRTEKVSRASATQRAGRAGRTGPGRAIRLYTAFDFETRPAFDTPEILRADLAELVLTARMAGVEPSRAPWLTAPQPDALAAAEALLARLGATRENEMTPLGRRLASIPASPRLARVLVEAERRGQGERGAAAAALLFDGATEGGPNARADFLATLERFEEHLLDDRRGGSATFATAANAYRQLLRHVAPRGARDSSGRTDPNEAVTLALLAGFPDRVARRHGRHGTTERREGVALTTWDGRTAFVRDRSAVGGDGTALILDARDTADSGGLDVRAAVPLRADWVLDVLGEHVETESTIEQNRETGRIETVDRLRYGRVVLDESRSSALGTDAAARLIVEEFRARGLDRKDALDTLRRRGKRAEAAGFAGLEAALEATILGAARTVERADELAAVDLAALFAAEHQALTADLARLAPAVLRLPSSRDLAIEYPADAPPFVESYLQDFFGLTASPRVGDVAVVIHLWAPNRRPVQVTADLASFWRTTYPELRRSLMRRYPKHYWPEDPTDAKATRFVRNV